MPSEREDAKTRDRPGVAGTGDPGRIPESAVQAAEDALNIGASVLVAALAAGAGLALASAVGR